MLPSCLLPLAYCSCLLPLPSASCFSLTDAREVEEAAFGVGREEADAYAFADIESFLAADDATVGGRSEQARERAAVFDARDDGVEGLADVRAQEHSRRDLAQAALDLARGGSHL